MQRRVSTMSIPKCNVAPPPPPSPVAGVLLKKREELIPVLLVLLFQPPDAATRNTLAQMLFNLVKRPNAAQRRTQLRKSDEDVMRGVMRV